MEPVNQLTVHITITDGTPHANAILERLSRIGFVHYEAQTVESTHVTGATSETSSTTSIAVYLTDADVWTIGQALDGIKAAY